MEGVIYQAPTVQKLIKSRISKFTHHLNNAFGETPMISGDNCAQVWFREPKKTAFAGKQRRGEEDVQDDTARKARLDKNVTLLHSVWVPLCRFQPDFLRVFDPTPTVEVSKLAELKDSAGGYDWTWQKETKALQEKAEALKGVGLAQEDRDAKAALKLSMDNILMVSSYLKPRLRLSSCCVATSHAVVRGG